MAAGTAARAALALWLVCGAFAGASPEALELFAVHPQAKRAATPLRAAAEHAIDLRLEVFASGLVSTGTWLRVEPAPGVAFTAVVGRIETDVNGTLSLYAPLHDRDFAYLTLSLSGDQVLGEVCLPDDQRRYAIRFDAPAKRHVARNVADDDLDELPPGPVLYPPWPPAPSADAAADALDAPEMLAATANTIVDVMVVYTPAAASWAGGTAGINNVIAQAISMANASMANSAVPLTFRLVHSAQVNYTESGNSQTDLARLQATSDGHMDVVHAWRNQYGADLVCLFANVSDVGGLGYALTSSGLSWGFAPWAFSLVRVQQASGLTTVHELGHNMGAGHHKQQNVQPGPQLYDYSAGWTWTGTNNANYCSVMAYNSGYPNGKSYARVAYFSNPSVRHMGRATGHSSNGDNARTLRATRATTAAYRKAPDPFWFNATALDNRVMLRWAAPTGAGFSTNLVHVRFSTADHPAATNQGTFLYQGGARQYLHTNPVSGQTHYYSIWLSHDGTTFVEP